mgnify:CR=1 FL=1
MSRQDLRHTEYATGDQQLLNAVPQSDSVSTLHISVGIEESFDLVVADDAVGAEDFFSIETLLNFVRKQIDASTAR